METLSRVALSKLGIDSYLGASPLDNFTEEDLAHRYRHALEQEGKTVVVMDGNHNHHVVASQTIIFSAWVAGRGISEVFAVPNELWEELKPSIRMGELKTSSL